MTKNVYKGIAHACKDESERVYHKMQETSKKHKRQQEKVL